MTPSEKDERKGRLFDAWVADLRQDYPPREIPEADSLPPDEVSDVLGLARWWAARTRDAGAPFDVHAFRHRIQTALASELDDDASTASALLERATDIGTAMDAVAQRRRLHLASFQRAVGLLPGMWESVISGSTPLHRIPLTTAARVLRALDLKTDAAIALTRNSSLQWAHRRFDGAASALGRTPTEVDAESRGILLSGADPHASALDRETMEIERFIASLRDELSKVSAGPAS